MNFVRFLEAYSIPHNVLNRRGWVELQCPFCDDRSQNLGYNLEKDYFSCWRCGGHRVLDTICRLAKVTTSGASDIIRRYSSGPQFAPQESIRIGEKKAFRFPSSVCDIQKQHRKYLEERGFDADRLVEVWRIMGTGPVAPLDNVDYKHRIVIPISWQQRVVSFQTRDITGKHSLRYMACPKQRELIEHQSIVYRHPSLCDEDEWTVAVEGVIDAWRMGPQAFATFGIAITSEQVRAIAGTFKKVAVLFDRETQAQKAARDLMGELRFRGVQCRAVSLPRSVKDPADLQQIQADVIMASIRYGKEPSI